MVIVDVIHSLNTTVQITQLFLVELDCRYSVTGLLEWSLKYTGTRLVIGDFPTLGGSRHTG